MNQVYVARRGAAGTLVVDALGAPINTQSYEGDPCVARDGHFLVFYSGRSGSSGGTDLYVSFRSAQGAWGEPINLGGAFNSRYDEYGAHLSADGGFLFFTRHAPGSNRIYWVATSAIEKLKP
jgi:Tol biopolymer transport system component